MSNTINNPRTSEGDENELRWDYVAALAAHDPWKTTGNIATPYPTIREILVAEAAKKKAARSYTQWDAEHEPRDEHGDREGDVIWAVERDELRDTDFPVRVQILCGTDMVVAARLLRKILEPIESGAADIKKLAESHSAADLRAAADLADKQCPF